MKKIFASVLIVAAAFSVSFAGSTSISQDRLDTYFSNIERSLKSDNDGVRFSAIYLLARLKADHPEMDLSQWNKKLMKMTSKDESELVRVHSKMTYLYLNDDEISSKVKIENKENPMPFFVDLHLELYSKKFDLNSLDVNEVIEEIKERGSSDVAMLK